MSGNDAVRAWTGMGFERADAPVSRTLAADSWLADDGRVLALDRHRLRFADAVADAGGDRLDALTAARHAARETPREGRWSPRLDLTPEGIRLRIRAAPEPSMEVVVTTATRDPRTMPERKGPDLLALGELQEEESARVGAPVEPVITVDGLVAEGAWSAVLWWRGDALCVPEATIPRLPSVTAAVIAELARVDGVELRHERAAPGDLEGCEVWLANALRGIRAVSEWIGGPRVGPAVHAPAWQTRLESLRTVPTASRR